MPGRGTITQHQLLTLCCTAHAWRCDVLSADRVQDSRVSERIPAHGLPSSSGVNPAPCAPCERALALAWPERVTVFFIIFVMCQHSRMQTDWVFVLTSCCNGLYQQFANSLEWRERADRTGSCQQRPLLPVTKQRPRPLREGWPAACTRLPYGTLCAAGPA